MWGMFPITATPKAFGDFGTDALYMNGEFFGSIIQHLGYIYTNKYFRLTKTTPYSAKPATCNHHFHIGGLCDDVDLT